MRDALGRGVAPPQAWRDDRQCDEQVGDADRGDGEHEARRPAEAADDGDLDDDTEQQREQQTADSPTQYDHPQKTIRPTEKATGRAAEVGLGEVDDPVGAVDEGEPDGEERGEHAEHDAAQPQPEGHPEEHELHRQDHRRSGDCRQRFRPGDPTERAVHRGGHSARVGVTRILQCVVGVAEGVERPGHAVEADLAGDQRGDVDLALGDRAQRVGELHRVVAEQNWRFSSLPMPKNGVIVSCSMHTPTTTMRVRGGAHAEDVVDDPGHADGLEDDRRPRLPPTRAHALERRLRRAGRPPRRRPWSTASARRAGEKSVATIGLDALALQGGDDGETDRARTRARARRRPAGGRARLTAWRPTAIGSVRAAWRGSSPFGTSSSSGAESSMRSP